jgi:hypothetical protein
VNGFGGVSASYTGTLNYNSAYSIQVGYSTALASNYYYDQYIRDLRVVQGGVVPVATFTPGAAPFSYASPGYVANMGTTVFTLLGQFVTYNPSGKYNTSLVMGGQTRYVYTPPSSIDLGTSGATISLWLKSLASTYNYFLSIVGMGGNGNTYINRFYVYIQNNTSKIIANFIDNTSTALTLTSTTSLAVGTWTHMCFTLQNGVMTIYINGTNEASRSDAPMSGVTLDSALTIAARPQSPGTVFMNAEYDDLRIYNTALTATQVQSVYSSQGAPAPSRAMPLPKLAWDFNGTNTPYIGSVSSTTVTGAVAYGSGKYGQDVIIRNPINGGFANVITYNLSTSIPVDAGVTFTLWVKYLALPASTFATTTFVISGTNVAIYLMARGPNIWIIGGFLNGSFHDSASVNQTLTTDTWYHMGLTVGFGQISMYFNGVLRKTSAYTLPVANSLTIARVGADNGYAGDNVELDDLRIFDRALTSAQVQSVFNQQGVPGRGVQVKSPIQPGYIYEPYNNYTILGNPDVKVLNSSNPDPRIYVDPAGSPYAQWTADPNLLTKWDLMPFKYYILLSAVFSSTATHGLRFPVYVPTTTTYDVQIFIYGAGGNTDSGFIAMDGEAAIQFGNASLSWRTGLSAKSLTAGNHTLELYMREPMGIGGIRIIPTGGTAPTLTAFRQNFTGTPLFTQLSPSATSSAVGAFSLRAVNGLSPSGTAKAVQVRPQGQFPPVAMTSNGPQNLTGYPFGGAGNYTASASSTFPGELPFYAFNKQDQANPSSPWNIWTSGGGTYNTTTGQYTGAASTTIDGSAYSGEWLQISLPTGIVLSNYTIFTWNLILGRGPRNFKIAGSNNGTDWVTVDTETGITNWTAAGFSFTTASTTAYSYFRLCVNYNNADQYGYTSIAEWKLFGSNASWNTDFYADRLGNLLTAPVVGQPLAKWLGGATGYVTTWYDQSGRGNHAIQNTAANQPIIQRATKGPGYACLFNGAQGLTGMSHTVLKNTNYSVVINERRTTSSIENYYIGSGNGATNNWLILGYRYNINLTHAQFSNDYDMIVSSYAGASEPIRYTSYTFSSTNGKFTYNNGALLGSRTDANGKTGLSSISGNFTIGSGYRYYTGEMYELLVFTQSLYDLDTSGGLITQVYQNQLGYTGA